jgi:streptogramin lyase
MSLSSDLAKMARDNGIETRKLANNSVSTDKLFQLNPGEFIGRDNTQSGTGNVGASQSFPDISLTSALSAPFNATTAWRSLSAYLNQVKQVNSTIPASAVYVEVFATNAYPVLGGSQNWEGGVLAPNGKIYCFPEQASVALIIDPVTNTTTTFGAGSFYSGGNAFRYQGCVLAGNGKIYGIPCGGVVPQTVFQLIDPSNNTITAYASIATLPPDNAFEGGVLAPNGKIYPAPSSNSVFYLIDPSNNTVSAFATYAAAAAYNYCNPVVGPNGKIYLCPIAATLLRVIDPDNNTITVIGTVPSYGLGNGANVVPNGKIYFSPNNSIGYIIDPLNNNTISTYSCAPTITGQINAFGGKLAPNGKIYFSSWTGTFFGVLDPENNTVTRLGTVATSSYLDMVLTPNGKLVLIPGAATSVTAYNFNLNQNWNLNTCLNPFNNKN